MTATGPADPTPATTQNTLSPSAAAPTDERIEVLDVLRGFALYGVLFSNMVQWFSGRAFIPRAEFAAHADAADQVFLFLYSALVDGKAMTLLTFLFGLGFALQLQRAEAGGRSVLPTYLRRLAALALIGMCHVLLLWWGDILWGYAIAGVGLLLFRRVRGWKLLAWGFGLALVPMLVAAIPIVTKAIDPILLKPADMAAFRVQMRAAITGHDRWVLTQMQVKEAYYHVGNFWVWYFPSLLGHFLVGYWAGMTRLFHEVEKRLSWFRRLAAWGLSVGVSISLIMASMRLLHRQKNNIPALVWRVIAVPSELGTMLLACGYAAAVVLLMRRPAFRRALLGIAPAGQMALTTYIAQSLICTFLFYGWGLGLFGRVQSARLFPITLVVFSLQLLFAHAWLARFRFGPLEWLWRSLTYGRMQPLRRARTPKAT